MALKSGFGDEKILRSSNKKFINLVDILIARMQPIEIQRRSLPHLRDLSFLPPDTNIQGINDVLDNHLININTISRKKLQKKAELNYALHINLIYIIHQLSH